MSDISFGWDFDDLNGYSYHINYWEEFFDVTKVGLAVRSVLEEDFVFNLADFLNGRFKVDLDTAFSIAKAVFTRMSSPELHFHTPVHVLSLFRFAFDHKIPLEDWERLAIWFHDSIYIPGAPPESNEIQSTSFMRGIVPGGLSCEDGAINRAERAILTTGRHPAKAIEKQYHLIMDMDLCNLAWPREKFEASVEALQTECTKVMTVRKFKAGWRRFYEIILSRGHIYRTEQFRDQFERTARQNIAKSLQSLVEPSL